jgi:GMP synthase (glutamine-hydrolysing)
VRVLAIVHDADAGPGVFAEAIASRGDRLDVWEPPHGGVAPDQPLGYDAVIVLGGAAHPDQEAEHPWLPAGKALLGELLAHGTPLLGVCLGAELLAEIAGARCLPMPRPQVGWCRVSVTRAGARDPLLGPLAPEFEALEWHSYECVLAPGAVELARSDACLQAFRAGPRAWGIQFHAEVSSNDLAAWIDQERSREELERLGFDRVALRASTRERIGVWNQLGRDLCARFLDAAAAATA